MTGSAAEGTADVTATETDEQLLPAMCMVWPVNWLPSSPAAIVPSGYAVRRCGGLQRRPHARGL